MKIRERDVKPNIYIFFIVTAAVWGLIMSFLVPVGQTPDENSHFSFMLEACGTNKLYPEDREFRTHKRSVGKSGLQYRGIFP